MYRPGLFECIIKETSEYTEKGLIKCFVNSVSSTDDDFLPVMISTPFGGLDQQGMHMCPPLGSKGYVMYPMASSSNIAIWMGTAVIKSFQNVGKQGEEKDVVPPEITDPTDFVIRTQYTSIDMGGEDLSSSRNKVENVIKMNRNELTFSKIKSDGYNYDNIKRAYQMINEKINYLSIKDSSITIKYKGKNDKIYTVIISEEGILLDVDRKIVLNINKDGIKMTCNNSILNDNQINMKVSEYIKFNSDKYIKIDGSDDNMVKWSGLFQLIMSYSSHNHLFPAMPGGPPVDMAIIFDNPGRVRTSSGTNIVEKVYQDKTKNVKWTLNRDLFGVKPSELIFEKRKQVSTAFSVKRISSKSQENRL